MKNGYKLSILHTMMVKFKSVVINLEMSCRRDKEPGYLDLGDLKVDDLFSCKVINLELDFRIG